MTSFTIINHITQREYVASFLKQFFFRPVMLLVCGWAVLVLVCYVGTITGLFPDVGFSDSSYLILPFIFFIAFPLMIFWTASRQYSSSAKMRQLVEYTFDDDGVSYKGDNFEGKYDWENYYLAFHLPLYPLSCFNSIFF